MQPLELVLQIIAGILSGFAFLLGIPLFFSFRWPAAPFWMIKVALSALSPVCMLIGLLTALAGWATGSLVIAAMGIAVATMYTVHFISITRPAAAATGFDQAFGNGWEGRIPAERKLHFLSGRSMLWLPSVPKPRMQQNICYATVPGTDRGLLCDIWQPAENVKPSGAALIFLHGSAFYFLDKDFGTRRLFTHLAGQGHLIMDVAYRLAPETDIPGMVQDAMRAVVWLRERAAEFGIDPSRIMVGGGSAGGHLALLVAYTFHKPLFTPPDLAGKDISVSAVISIYGTTDLEALYYHTNQHITTRSVPGHPKKAVPDKMPGWMKKMMGTEYHRLGFDKFGGNMEKFGTLPPLMGGHPDECPERYALWSPVSHVHPHCPPTLIIHGKHDIMSPLRSARQLYLLLLRNNVPAVMHELPQSDHGFDLVMPRIAPGAHNALFDVERFMALLAAQEPQVLQKDLMSATGSGKRAVWAG